VNSISQEKSLLEGLAKEDKSSIEQIYRDNYTMIQSLILNNNGTTDDAADIFQEAMIVLFEKSRTAGFELNCQLKTYIYSVCRRLWLKRLQQMQRFGRQTEDTTEMVPVDDDLEVHEKRQVDFKIMEDAMSKIGEPCKSLLEAYYIQKKNMLQIATEFGYTNADNAKTQKYKCLVRLKKLFFAQYKNGQ
jgi:RNA polymerase sigma factor (sigma-70 family)